MTHTLGLALAGALIVQTQATAPASDAGNRVTVTGCVERADQVMQTGTLGTTFDSLDFVLMRSNEDRSGAGTSGAAAATSTDRAATAPAAGQMYLLAGDTAKLNPHVGHKVEISGVVQKPAVPGSTPSDPLTNAGTLKVDSIKMIATTCPR